MNIWHDVQPALIRKEEYTVFTANSMGSTARLSFDGAAGMLCLDHMSDSGVGAPNNTGFVPRTCTKDGLPIETILLCSQPLPPMTLVRCRPVGLIVLHLEKGESRTYLLSSVCADEFWSACLTVDEIPAVSRKALVRFLHYDQQLQRRPVTSTEFLGLERAEKYIETCGNNYLVRFCGRISEEE